VASEGVWLPSHDNIKEEKDEFGHMILKNRGVGEELAELIEKQTSLETRASSIGHVQRGGSPSLFDRILGMRVGAKAADLVQKGDWGKMVALRGTDVVGVPLKDATGTLKLVSKEWIDFARVFQK
jgi:6-phosphofructokinase 1